MVLLFSGTFTLIISLKVIVCLVMEKIIRLRQSVPTITVGMERMVATATVKSINLRGMEIMVYIPSENVLNAD